MSWPPASPDRVRNLIVIPARWGSTRLPGKPLADLAGKTLLQRAAAIGAIAASRRPETGMVVATDDDRVADHARALGHAVVVTGADVANGTARALAAARAMAEPPAFIVNLQGDNPFTPPATLLAMIDALAAGASVATPVVSLDWADLDRLRQHKVRSPFSGTTCVRDAAGRALWFSKQILPAIRDEADERARTVSSPVFRHVGLYGYTLAALEAFCAASPSPYERLEGLEQLRFFALGLPIQTIAVGKHPLSMSGIDTADDLAAARRLLALHGEPDWG